MPRMFFGLSLKQEDCVIELWYTDSLGNEHGPYEFEFETQKESQDGNRNLLEMTSTSWLSFRDFNGNTLVYFTHLLGYRGALSKIEYGIDTPTPNKELKFTPWDKAGYATLDENQTMYLKIPANTQYATVQLTYKNGDKSEILQFDR